MTPEGIRQALADAFCANGQCGGDQSSAPCERSRMLAGIALDVVSLARLQAFEEAAKIAEHNDHIDCMAAKAIAAAIRQHAKGDGE